ncbi:MAG: FtsX-like permease family protein [Nitrospinota bacterium]|nr:FtsX-like permease family protein [Nitrospinota bacterium]
MIFQIAWKNFHRRGISAFLNMLVTSLVLIALIFMVSLLNGFQAQATRNLASTDIAGGNYRLPAFDILTPTEWEDLTFPVPDVLKDLSPQEKSKVLVLQGQLFPNRRLYPVQLRGINMEQTLLDLPLDGLKKFDREPGDLIPLVVGTQMAKKAKLKKGDSIVLKWRDRFGVIDARDILVVDVADIVNPRVDVGVLWLRLDHLRAMTRREGEVSWVAVKNYHGPVSGVEFQTRDQLMADLLALLKQDRLNSKILWAILMILAGTSVFNTQILSIFKRQREIGTLMALGMDSYKIVRLFTLEGSLSAFGAVGLAAFLGTPLFIWFQGVGFDVSHLSEATMPVREKIFLDIQPLEVALSVLIVVAIMILVAWLPVKKISRVDPTLALRGRGIT